VPTKPPTHKPAHWRSPAQRARDYDRRRKADPELAEAARLRGLTGYQRFRAWFRSTYPLCCDPLGEHRGVLMPMREVHHVRGLQAHPEDLCDETQCAPLCSRCHAGCEAAECEGGRVQLDGWRDRWPYRECESQ
jgi:hypothetical protein